MKKIFLLTLLIGSLAVIFTILHGSDLASGALNDPSIGVVEQYSIEHTSPPWMDFSWHYRRPITISSSSTIPLYQVLITLNNVNFPSFDLAKPDGSDVRFTFSDGINELPYWIESWNNETQLAYVWVRLPYLGSGETIIYLYYNNPSATSTSNGNNTFDGFDDNWLQFATEKTNQLEGMRNLSSIMDVESAFTWSVVNVTPHVDPPGILNLGNGTGIKSDTTYLYQAIGFKANYGLSGVHERAGFLNHSTEKGTVVGNGCLTSPSDLFLINDATCTGFNPSGDWDDEFHVYEVRWRPGMTTGIIDHGSSNASSTENVPNTLLPVTMYSYPDSNATLMVDWVYVRQYHDPEPIAKVGAEQGLVDLDIKVDDSPDPLQADFELTYLISVSNTSSIDAPGVIVTDTLPGNVIFIKTIPPDCNYLAGVVVCNMNTIVANSTETVSIVVSPYIDGELTNTALVDSPSFEIDSSNNSIQSHTLVDSVAPNVNWVKPVISGQKYTTHGGVINLEASAADNDQVAWVDFWYWDHLANPAAPVPIGTDYTYPYQTQLNGDELVANTEYQVFVQAGDRADNVSSIYTVPYPVIYLTRISENHLYLPISMR